MQAATLECDSPAVFDLPQEEIREPYLEIIEPAAGNRVVTAIEVLSPTNKTVGFGRNSYVKKRDELWAAGVNLIEIDLLRDGDPTVWVSRPRLESLRPWHFVVVVARQRGLKQEVYAVPLRDRLPRVAVPLADEDKDVPLDLQAAFTRCWDEGAISGSRFGTGALPMGTMSPAEDASWCGRSVREDRECAFDHWENRVMPLLDYLIRLPLSRTRPWRSFHGAWAATIARLLNQGLLPEGYYAVPLVDRDGPIEVDVATLRDVRTTAEGSGWTAPEPNLTTLIELPATEDVEVHVLTDDGDPRLMAAIELVCPRNKDRPQAREAFVSKCVGYLQKGSSVIVVDTVTTRRAELIAEILSRLDAESTLRVGGLSATAFRTVAGAGDDRKLQVWQSPMELGKSLPTLPLWIESEFSVQLDLDVSYRTTCEDLRIRQAL